jgi:hypothetical protein
VQIRNPGFDSFANHSPLSVLYDGEESVIMKLGRWWPPPITCFGKPMKVFPTANKPRDELEIEAAKTPDVERTRDFGIKQQLRSFVRR